MAVRSRNVGGEGTSRSGRRTMRRDTPAERWRIPSPRSGRPSVYIDHVAVVGEFLTEVDNIDIIVELVQNELDAGSTRTEIEIGDDALICSGNGSAMAAKGWERLRFVLGAGVLVDAKVDGIGSKNHGIRTGFLLGDTITVQSDRHRIDLTAKGSPDDPENFYPAAWPKERDLEAPKRGVRVTIPFRVNPTKTAIGNPLEVPTTASLDKLFEDATAMAPDRFLCASPPARNWQYELVLRRGAKLARLSFRSTTADKAGLSMRTCHLSHSARPGRLAARTACSSFEFIPNEQDHAKIPRLYRRGRQIVCELCWPSDAAGKPQRGAGTYRYPIAFPRDQAGNGLGFDISGPFVAGKARHSLGEDRRNIDLIAAARRAFVELMRDILVPGHGPEALRLLENVESPRPADIRAMVEALIEAGALPVWSHGRTTARGPRHERSAPGVAPILPMPRYGGGKLDATLAELAPATHSVLDPATPGPVVTAMREIARIQAFDEVAAARTVFVDSAPEPGEQRDGWIQQCEKALRLLEVSRLSGNLTPADATELKKSGRLPTTEGVSQPWIALSRATIPPPRIPGVQDPKLLNLRLAKSTIMREGSASVPLFKLDLHLARLDFSRTIAAGRAKFFQWLLCSHALLSPTSLGKIAEYPIWPDEAGVGHPLPSYCWPKARYLRLALSSAIPMPAPAVVSFPGLRKASNGALRLTSNPSNESLTIWHDTAMGRVRAAADAEAAMSEAIAIEEILDRMREDGYSPKNFAHGHLSVSRTNAVGPIANLHADTAAVRSCHLASEDLLPPERKTLHLSLGANPAPLPDALIKVLRADPKRSRLAARLGAYRTTGRPLTELSQEAIVEIDGALVPPASLAFEASTDMWGEWKRRIPIGGLAPDEAKLLEETGVLRNVKDESSMAFFGWLSGRDPSALARHRVQIVRHWLDQRVGPSRWGAHQQDVPCVLVHAVDRHLSLLSIKEASAKGAQVYLPDMRSIQSAILADNPRMKLVVVDARRVDGSAIREIQDRGVKSLSEKVGAPVGLTIIGDSQTDERLDAEVRLLQSARVRGHLKSMLPHFQVPGDRLLRDFRRFLAGIGGVRAAKGLEAQYVYARRQYRTPTTAGYSRENRTFYVAIDSTLTMPFYEAVAREIFAAQSPPAYAYGLYQAVHEITAPDFAQSHLEDSETELESEGEDHDDASPKDDRSEKNQPTGGSAAKGHGLPADIDPFLPKPKKLEKLSGRTYTAPSPKHRKSHPPASTDALRHSIEEDEQLNRLKFEHYAAHCQACLGTYDVLEAAPPGSYVHSPHYRKSMIHAHHVKLLINLGKPAKDDTDGFGARNVVILCRYHHAQLGDLLSGETIRTSLEAAAEAVRNFPDGAGRVETRKGLLARIELADDPHEAELYFTREHAQAWLGD